MDIDTLKNIWKETPQENEPEINLEQKTRLFSPLDKVKTNMKMEFYSLLFIIPFLIFFFVEKIDNPITLFYSLVLLVVSLVLISYYYLQFYRLYKKISEKNLKTYHHLMELKYDLNNNIVLYKSYYISFLPILFGEIVIIFQNNNVLNPSNFNPFMIMFLIILFTGSIALYLSCKIWLYYYYERYILQTVKIINTLIQYEDNIEEEKTDIFMKLVGYTHVFFNKFLNDKYSVILNFIIWLIILYTIVRLIIMVISGFIFR